MDAASLSLFDIIMQVGLVGFTAIGFALTSFKLPQYGLPANLVAQFFWIYSSWIAWRDAHQIGIFIITVVMTIIIAIGVLNYWSNLDQKLWSWWSRNRSSQG